MKTNKLLAAGALALSMTMSPFASLINTMPLTVLAAETQYTISVDENDEHTYKVYQIFTGDLDKDGNLSNIKWGTNGTGAVGESVPDTIIKEILDTKEKSNKEKLDVITKYVKTNSDPVGRVSKDNPLNVVAGYYLITENDDVTGNDSSTLFLAEVAGNVKISPKKDVPHVEKKVKDKNDTDGTTTGWQDSADHDFKDQVDFKLEATLPKNYTDYSKYTLVFHDTYDTNAFEFVQDSLEVKYGTDEANATTIDSSKYSTETAVDDNLTVTFNDLKTAVPEATNGTKIFVTYKLKLKDSADLGKTQLNQNTVHLEFSNNPNVGHDGEKGTTPNDTVRVFTYKVTVTKTDNEDKPLSGAGFTLYKKVKNAQGNLEEVKIGDEIKPESGNTFEFKGLDDGIYVLKETTVPTDYSKANDIEFTITATHDVENENPQLTAITINKEGFVVDEDTMNITTKVVNTREGSLPETGGMGTTMIYSAGALLAVGAAVVYVTNKRTRKN